MALEKEEGTWYYWVDASGEIMRSPLSFDANNDRLRGECSGLPPCCIDFYIKKWRTESDIDPDKHEELMDEARKQGFEFQYVACIECLAARRFVDLRICDGPHCFCGQWEHRQATGLRFEPMKSPEHRREQRRVRMSRKRRRGYA